MDHNYPDYSGCGYARVLAHSCAFPDLTTQKFAKDSMTPISGWLIGGSCPLLVAAVKGRMKRWLGDITAAAHYGRACVLTPCGAVLCRRSRFAAVCGVLDFERWSWHRMPLTTFCRRSQTAPLPSEPFE
jgi:hypothetical protein